MTREEVEELEKIVIEGDCQVMRKRLIEFVAKKRLEVEVQGIKDGLERMNKKIKRIRR